MDGETDTAKLKKRSRFIAKKHLENFCVGRMITKSGVCMYSISNLNFMGLMGKLFEDLP
jgi:hypothetical protein